MHNPHRGRKIALGFFVSGWVTCAAAFLLPLPTAADWIRTALFIYGSSAILFGGGTAAFRHFDARAKEALARGEDVIARWRVEPAAWNVFVALDRQWNEGRAAPPNELCLPAAMPENGIEVIVGRSAVQIGESIHRLTSGMPEVTAATLIESQPAVIDLQLYYPGGGHGASGVPHSARRAALRFPVGRGARKEAGGVVAHYRGDLGRKPDFFHGKGDGTNPEDLTECYNCGYETYKLASHCPQCGRSMQSKRWSRRYGVILLVLGLIITAIMSFVFLLTGPMLLHPGTSHGGSSFSGTASQARLVLGILGAVELFGVTAICYGLWQIVTGRRSKWVIYVCLAFGILMFLVALFF